MYESFYKLSAKPFRLSPDSVFFYPSRGHKRALAYLRYGLSQSEGFVVITGAPGTGKTTLAQILLKEMDQRHLVVAHLTTTQLEADEMLRMVAASFGLRYEGLDKAGLLKTLESFLLARARERKRALLVVDEAQNLPARSLEELRMLSNLQVGDKALLQTFLLGQPQFRQMLEHPDLEQLRQRVIANYHLSPLAPDECRNYVESRLKQVGWANDPSFAEHVFETIYEYSEGIPRRINMLCDRVLLFSFLEEQHQITDAILRQVTDELGQEVSGRPLPAEGPVETLLHDDKPEVAEPPQAEDGATTESADEEPPIHDNSDKLEAALQEEELHEHAAEEAVEAETQQPPEVFELASTEPSLMDPAAAEPGETTEDNGLDRAIPDEGWTQPQPQMDTAEAEEEEPAGMETAATAEPTPADEPAGKEAADEGRPGQQDRFRVIPGGRDNAAGRPQPVVLAPLPDAPGDSEEVTTRKVLRLVLAFHRSPRSFPGLDDPNQPLPRGVRNILQLAVSDDEVLRDLRQISVMGISPAMLRAAVRFFVRRVMFVPGSDDYRVLGLQQGASLAEIEINYGLLMRLLRHDNAEVVDSGVSRIGAAYENLCRGVQGPPTPAEEENPVLSDIEAIDNIGDLDLDVAPRLAEPVATPSQSQAAMQPQGGQQQGMGSGEDVYAAIDEGGSGSLVRNVILVAGLVVVLLVLYITQVRGLHRGGDEGPVSTPALPAAPVEVPPLRDEAAPEPGTATEEDVMDSSTTSPRAEDDSLTAPPSTREEDAALAAQVAEEEARAAAEERAAAEARLSAEREAKARAAEEARLKAEEEARARAAEEARLKAEEEARAKAAEEARLKAEKEARARAAEAARLKAEKEAKAAEAARLQAEKAAREKQAAASAAVATAGIGDTELTQLLNRFVAAYEKGDQDGLAALFEAKARTDTQTTRAGIRTEFEKAFADSRRRSMAFKGLSWKREGNFARGRGSFQTTVLPRGAEVPVLTSGKVTLQVNKGERGLQISRLYFSDVTTVEGSAPATAQTATAVLSEENLNPLMRALVTYYEAGDIDAFMDLFSSDASSNDRPTVAGIRKDYQGLFEDTVARRMELKNLHWKVADGVARGESDYVVEVQARKRGGVDVYRGTLWVQVEPRNGLARITHFAFVE